MRRRGLLGVDREFLVRAEWYLPVGLSASLLALTAVCLYTFARLEMGRVNASGVVVVGVAFEILMMALWALAGPV